mmetsp:Transcript_17050/g.27593  ORF Transcript_17050/g.27593 Transcript_17050/m.27593 type:complete len:283 (+) Transcript_17050:447-1295(+)
MIRTTGANTISRIWGVVRSQAILSRYFGEEAHGAVAVADNYGIVGVGRSRVKETGDETRVAGVECLEAVKALAGEDLSVLGNLLIYTTEDPEDAVYELLEPVEKPASRTGVRFDIQDFEDLGQGFLNVFCQALVISSDGSKILLKKHDVGAYQDRYTGLMGMSSAMSFDDESGLKSSMEEILASNGLSNIASLSRHGLLEFSEFDELEPAVAEHVFVATLSSPVEDSSLERGLSWHPLLSIPYKEMPEDDEVWYGQVLDRPKDLVRGGFVFEGKRMVSNRFF